MALIKTRCCFKEQQRQQLFFLVFNILSINFQWEKPNYSVYQSQICFSKTYKPRVGGTLRNSFCVAARLSNSWPYFRPCHFPHSIEVNKYNLWKASCKNLVVQEPAGRNLLFSQARSERMVLISELQLNYDKLFQGDGLWDLQIYNQKINKNKSIHVIPSTKNRFHKLHIVVFFIDLA